jgi:murein DD-endopeptidase MepM/ murein hydrolase activator NlpD
MRKKIYVWIMLLIMVGAFSFIYTNSIAPVNEQNFKALTIYSLESARTDKYELSDTDTALLFEELTGLHETEDSVESIDSDYEFQIIMANRWGVSRVYRVLYADDMTVFVQNQAGALYKLDKPSFFYNHEWFPEIYADRDAPGIQITVKEKEVQPQGLEQNWNFQRHDGEPVSRQTISAAPDGEGVEYASIVSMDDSITVFAEKPPDSSHLIIRNGSTGSVVFDGEARMDHLTYPRNNGQYDFELILAWNDAAKPYQGQYVVNFTVVVDLPERLELSKQQLIQGDILEVVYYNATSPEDIYFEQTIFKDFTWHVQGDMLRGYIPTNYNTKAGVYEIKYGNRKTGYEKLAEIQVVAHEYRIQRMYINPSIDQGTRNEAAYAEFAEYFTPVRKQSASTRYYTEPFVIPVKGRLTTEFGQTRYINDSPTSSRHSGLDIAAPTGTTIVATNRGKVVLAMPLILTGNTIVIDHGEGLFSVYYHMHELFVATGDVVERGQAIAAVGTTGFSTGPHLHFMISYYAMNLEPGFFIAGQPITLANYREFLQ